MAVTIREIEDSPTAYPVVAGLSTAAQALDAAAIWQRIEAYTAHRFTARDVVWLIEGGGEWLPPLTPATVATVEVWADGAWASYTPEAAPVGLDLGPGDMFRVTASVGGGDVPAAVSEAFRRLAEYLADDPGRAGASSTSASIGSISETLDRAPNWVALAMRNSGAGDLLRPYRRA